MLTLVYYYIGEQYKQFFLWLKTNWPNRQFSMYEKMITEDILLYLVGKGMKRSLLIKDMHVRDWEIAKNGKNLPEQPF